MDMPYAQSIKIENRDDFIFLGRSIAAVLTEYDPDRKFVISLEGDANSGKSLLALAANFELRPKRYPYGLNSNVSVHNLDPKDPVFFNDGFDSILIMHKLSLPQDRITLKEKWKKIFDNSNHGLFFLSNVWSWTHLSSEVGDNSNSPDTISVDFRLNVTVSDPNLFVRLVEFKSDDRELVNLIIQRFHDHKAGLIATRKAVPKNPSDLGHHQP
jgi:hypothetical protein